MLGPPMTDHPGHGGLTDALCHFTIRAEMERYFDGLLIQRLTIGFFIGFWVGVLAHRLYGRGRT